MRDKRHPNQQQETCSNTMEHLIGVTGSHVMEAVIFFLPNSPAL